jgi:CheY-like chemotaxis protein
VARVLVAEPEPDLRLLAEQALLELGHEPVAPDAQRVGDAVDVLLLAPSDQTLALTYELRRRHPQLPIVCVATHAPNEEVRRLRAAAHLLKPYTLAELQQALARALDAR